MGFKLENGSLTMGNFDLDYIKGWIDEDGYSPRKALKISTE
jgi:hypothetical protein